MDAKLDAKLERLSKWGADIPGTMARLLGDKELYESCLQMFVDDKNFSALGISLKEKNYQQVFDEVHTLKGVAGNLGLLPLYTVLCTMTEALRAKDYSALDQQFRDVEDKYEEFKKLVQEP